MAVIKVTPEIVRGQASRLNKLSSDVNDSAQRYANAVARISSACSSMNVAGITASAGLVNNKMRNVSNSLSADAAKANNAADQFDAANSKMAKLISSSTFNINGTNRRFVQNPLKLKTGLRLGIGIALNRLRKLLKGSGSGSSDSSGSDSSVSAEWKQSYSDWQAKVTDAEYGKLCSIWNDVANNKDATGDFIKRIKSELPAGDPLTRIPDYMINSVHTDSGLSVITIRDGSGNAFVLFAGTNDGSKDIWADAKLTFGIESEQEKEAKAIIEGLSKNCSNIVVTGHSLGGYLATAVTLDNSSVSKCVAFDPPGRHDSLWQSWVNSEQTNKITTYEAVGSAVSAVGTASGHYNPVFVEPNNAVDGDGFNPVKPLGVNHDIDGLVDAIGGDSDIRDTWNLGETDLPAGWGRYMG